MKLLLTLALLLPVAALGAERRVAFEYDVRAVGLFDMTLAGEAEFLADRYAVGMRLATTGMGDVMARFRMQARSEGVIASPPMPRKHVQGSESRLYDRRTVSIRYDDTGLPSTEVTPPITKDDRDPVQPEQARGAVDLLSALARSIQAASPVEACQGRIPVFDGRRRYDLVPEAMGTERLEPPSSGSFAGTALRCAMKQVRIAGFKKTDKDGRTGETLSFTVWLAQPAGWPVVMPVRIETESGYGRVISHIAKAEVDGAPLALQRP